MLRARLRTLLHRFFALPVARLLLALHVTPNAATLLGLILSLVAGYLLATGHFLAGGGVLLGGSAFDMVDGALARLSGRVTPFGGFLDSVVDRLAEAAVLFGLLWHFTTGADRTGAVLAYLSLAGSLMVSYMRARGEGLGVASEVGLMQRPERVVLLAVGTMLGYPKVTLGVVAALSFVTAGQRLVHVWRRTRSH